MKLYCKSCNEFVADFVTGYIRKGAVMVCRECMKRLQIAEEMAKMARGQTPDVVKDIFGLFNKGDK